MKRILMAIGAAGYLAAVATAQTLRYEVIDLGTLGGTSGSAYGINSYGRVAGAANLANGNQHAFLSEVVGNADLGTLGGPNSNEGGLNTSYQLAIFAETAKKDPNGEDFCGFGTHLICLPAVWNGRMTPLPTLGGNNGQALAINEQGQLAGIAETGTQDSTCVGSGQVMRFEAALWSPTGQVQELPPLAGDTVGFALGINNQGQVVGSSGTCANTNVAGLEAGPRAVLWNNGAPINLGSLGGTISATAAAVNDLGVVTGASDLASEMPGFPGVQIHGFLWTSAGGMVDIGTVGSDFSSIPTAINNRGQVTGASCDDQGNCRAFLWQNNVMTDLNTLIPADSGLYLAFPFVMNDDGEIAGMAIVTSTGDSHAFLAIPEKAVVTSAQVEPAMESATRPMPIPESAGGSSVIWHCVVGRPNRVHSTVAFLI